MAEASVFLRKKKDKQRQRVSSHAAPSPPTVTTPRPEAAPSPKPKVEVETANGLTSNNSNIIEFKLISSGKPEGVRHNLMRLNASRDVDPTIISRPILFNRKTPGPKAPPVFAYDEGGNVKGRYVYAPDGKPVLGEDGQPVVEMKDEADLSLVGTAPGQPKRKVKKGVKEVFHQDIELIRLRREENMPWILESGQPKDNAAIPEHWVGRLIEPSSMPTVLLINDGTMGMGFSVVPLGRTYRFDPERPFKVLDPEAAHKLYEYQSKYKIHDRWAQRESSTAGPSQPRQNTGSVQIKQEQRVARLEQQMRAARGDVQPRDKTERFDDDYKREGRRLERGMEGGEDEELDYDAKEEFQDDEENNTFYRNEEEEEEAKLQEEQLKKEFKMANVNVGDRPQIDSGEDEDEEKDDLFGDKLNIEGKRLRRMMKKRDANDDMYDSGSDEGSESESVKSDKTKGNKDDEKDKEGDKTAPSSVERLSRSSSRGPHSRSTTSPTGAGRRPNPPTPNKAGTAPPGSGSAFLAQRAASRGASPRRSRQNSPVSGRAQSPDGPTSRGVSPSAVRDSSSGPSTQPRPRKVKGMTPSRSPAPQGSNAPSPSSASHKRKGSPTPSVTGSDTTTSRKKKKSSSTTPTPGPEIEPFEGIITREEVVEWLRQRGSVSVPMSDVISSFRSRIQSAGDRQGDNSKVFLSIITSLTIKEPNKMLKVRDGIL